MKCKYCSNEIPDHSVFCLWCGERVAKKKRERDAEVSVPAPKKCASGYRIQLRLNGQSIPIIKPTAKECIAEAKAVKSGVIEKKKNTPPLTVYQIADKYIADRREILSPSTIRGYECYRDNRFQFIRDKSAAAVDWQQAINEQQKDVSAKTMKNTWMFYASALKAAGLTVPDVSLKQVLRKDEPWLDYEQIQIFLKLIIGKYWEIAALLALNSLRRSELLAVTPEKIVRHGDDWFILVEGAIVRGPDGMVSRAENKNSTSRREVPVINDRIVELAQSAEPGVPLVRMNADNLYTRINEVCQSAGLPLVGVHGLRRSFASLAFHLGWDILYTQRCGGWKDDKILKEIYTKLSTKDLAQKVSSMRDFNKNAYVIAHDIKNPTK